MMRDYVDYWAVLVTNTTDNTSAVVKSIMEPVAGEVVEEQSFTDFASARNQILQVSAVHDGQRAKLHAEGVVHLSVCGSLCRAQLVSA